jgi:hypothetical protein
MSLSSRDRGYRPYTATQSLLVRARNKKRRTSRISQGHGKLGPTREDHPRGHFESAKGYKTGTNSLVLTLHCAETRCCVEITCIAWARPQFFRCRGCYKGVRKRDKLALNEAKRDEEDEMLEARIASNDAGIAQTVNDLSNPPWSA